MLPHSFLILESQDPDKASEWKKLNNVQRFDVALDLIIKSGFISYKTTMNSVKRLPQASQNFCEAFC